MEVRTVTRSVVVSDIASEKLVDKWVVREARMRSGGEIAGERGGVRCVIVYVGSGE